MLVVSDIHFGADSSGVEPLIDGIVALARRTSGHAVILPGDFTQRARPREFSSARMLVEKLLASNIHVIATPGNHDFGRWFGEKFSDERARGRYRQAIFEPIAAQPIVRATRDVDLVAEVGLDVFVALRSTHAWWRRAGRVRMQQIEWATCVLRTLRRQQTRVHLVTHRSLWRDLDVEHRPMHRIERLVMDLLAPLRVDSVICGHNHVPRWGHRTVGALSWQVHQVSAPTLAQARSRGFATGLLEWDPSSPGDTWFISTAQILAADEAR